MLEGVFEGGVAEGVAGWVDGAVDVAEPVADGPEGVWDADGTEGVDQDHHVVRRPRGNESDQDGHDGARHLFLPGRNALPFPLCNSVLLCHLEMRVEKMLFMVLGHWNKLQTWVRVRVRRIGYLQSFKANL